jgi:hypothetical protein
MNRNMSKLPSFFKAALCASILFVIAAHAAPPYIPIMSDEMLIMVPNSNFDGYSLFDKTDGDKKLNLSYFSDKPPGQQLRLQCKNSNGVYRDINDGTISVLSTNVNSAYPSLPVYQARIEDIVSRLPNNCKTVNTTTTSAWAFYPPCLKTFTTTKTTSFSLQLIDSNGAVNIWNNAEQVCFVNKTSPESNFRLNANLCEANSPNQIATSNYEVTTQSIVYTDGTIGSNGLPCIKGDSPGGFSPITITTHTAMSIINFVVSHYNEFMYGPEIIFTYP